VDMETGMDIAELLHTVKPARTIIVAAGDADFIPAVERAKSKGWRVEVWFWSNAAADLKKAEDVSAPLIPRIPSPGREGHLVSPP
jgi:uncharacterized LabA/DUF88 family protein